MRPKERRETGQSDLLRSRLDSIIDMNYALVSWLGRWTGASWKSDLERCTATSLASHHFRHG